MELMKKKNKAIIGGEGNGGVFIRINYGRDSLVGVLCFLTHLE
jgi:phosphomannomutase